MPATIKNWSAKRSGATMTILGETEGGDVCQVTGVEIITAIGAGVIARTVEGENYLLLPQADDMPGPGNGLGGRQRPGAPQAAA